MSKYTTELRYICMQLVGYSDDTTPQAYDYVVRHGADKIFDFASPLRSDHWETIKRLFVHTYYRREIGFETYGEFKRRLIAECGETGRLTNKYLPLFQAWDSMDRSKPFNNTDYVETNEFSGTNDSKTTTKPNNTVTGKTVSKFNDTPMGEISSTENNKYLTSLTINENEINTTGTDESRTEGSNGGENTRTVKGKTGGLSYIEEFNKFKHEPIALENDFVEELNDLFMLIY